MQGAARDRACPFLAPVTSDYRLRTFYDNVPINDDRVVSVRIVIGAVGHLVPPVVNEVRCRAANGFPIISHFELPRLAYLPGIIALVDLPKDRRVVTNDG
jgi:hypothetical protein